MKNWEKKPAIEGKHGGCLNCGPRPDTFPADGVIAVGFGYAALLKGREEIWSEEPGMEFDECMTGAQAEQIAAGDPDHDWRIILHAPLSSRTYQRHGPSEWVLIKQDMGFA